MEIVGCNNCHDGKQIRVKGYCVVGEVGASLDSRLEESFSEILSEQRFRNLMRKGVRQRTR